MRCVLSELTFPYENVICLNINDYTKFHRKIPHASRTYVTNGNKMSYGRTFVTHGSMMFLVKK